ncbi:MAG: alcohol dehydrogenase, partial [Acidimicrobiia bacterium]
YARQFGATHTINARQADVVEAVKELTEGRGADYAFEVIGLPQTIRQAYAMARRGGTVTVVGAGRFDDEVPFGAMELMADAKTIRGCVYGATDPARDVPRILGLHQAGRLDLSRLVTRRAPLAEVNEAFRAMSAGEGVRTILIPV